MIPSKEQKLIDLLVIARAEVFYEDSPDWHDIDLLLEELRPGAVRAHTRDKYWKCGYWYTS